MNGEPETNGQWPPRVGEPRTLPFSQASGQPLSVDESARAVDPHQFQPGRLAGAAQGYRPGELAARVADGGAAPAAASGERVQAVVFDPKNPSGRTRADAIFDAQPEDFARRQSELLRGAVLAGVVIELLVLGVPSLLIGAKLGVWGWLRGVVAGALGGAAARYMGDGPVTWMVAMGLAAGLQALPLGPGAVLFAVPVGVTLAWVAGLSRLIAVR